MTVLAVHGGGVASTLKVGWTDNEGRYQEMSATSGSFELVGTGKAEEPVHG
jgi:hypothetical protein